MVFLHAHIILFMTDIVTRLRL